MTNKQKTNFTPLFPNFSNAEKVSSPLKNSSTPDDKPVSDIHPMDLNHRYQTGDAFTILFLSKRGMSRSPLAREVLREKIGKSPFFGKYRVSSRGVTQAYDQCPIDGNLRTYADKLGYVLQGYSRFATLPDIAQADLIIPLDHESDDFAKVHKQAIRGKVRTFGTFLSAGSVPFLEDPYDREGDVTTDERYYDIIQNIKLGCSKIIQALPSLILNG
jgi:protein-tyrosine-phosphatase